MYQVLTTVAERAGGWECHATLYEYDDVGRTRVAEHLSWLEPSEDQPEDPMTEILAVLARYARLLADNRRRVAP